MEYNPASIEQKWRDYWTKNEIYKISNDTDRPKCYVLDMFPYPSGSGLHVGHPLGYIATDIYSRYKRLKGFNVLHPMGYDAFGLPAEQYAVSMGVHPATSTDKNIEVFRSQLDNIGFSYDWSREVKTSNPDYYKWTQWIFLQIYDHYFNKTSNKAESIESLIAEFNQNGNQKVDAANSQESSFSAEEWNSYSPKQQSDILMNYRLAYRKVSTVNWCEELGTVLANDEVKDGVSERGGYPVVQKPVLQWSLRTTAYAERLLNGLDDLDWSDSLKTQQRNWIGRSEGAQMFFRIENSEKSIEVFTTRPDTIYGATYMALAPEHEYVDELTTADQKQAIDDYQSYVQTRSELDRMSDVKKVTGCFTGSYAINPFNGKRVPIWIAEYVLAGYGTGAIMAVPSDDERDQRFAEKFGLEIIPVVDKSDYPGASLDEKVGKMINSDFLDGMEVKDAIKATLEKMESEGIGNRKINYKLRDANYSRQRYWGEPIPIVYDEQGIEQKMDISELPLILPDLNDFKPTSDGKAPLAKLPEWTNLSNGMTREVDTMPGFAGSSWYFLRYMDPDNDQEFASKKALDYWKEVDLYIGGAEHAVGHLMYSRMWHKFLFDKGLVPTDEPFKKLVNQGMIQGVIEYLYMKKSKVDGYTLFVCSKIALSLSEEELEDYTRIPIDVNIVQEYGGAQESYLNIESIKKFIEWRPEYSTAKFQCGKGYYQNGKFYPAKDATDSLIYTESEAGKMGKRYFNAVNPDDIVAQYGADCYRMYEMFLGPLEAAKPWDTKGIEGVSKFLKKFWALFYQEENWIVNEEPASKEALKALHTAIKKVSGDIERLSFNTCVSAFMVCVNDLRKLNVHSKAILEELVVLLAPFAPHVAEEIWHKFGHETSVHLAKYPEVNESYLVEASVTYPICINGKKRATADFATDATKEDMEKEALALEIVQKWVEGKTVRKVIVVPKRMVNIVVS